MSTLAVISHWKIPVTVFPLDFSLHSPMLIGLCYNYFTHYVVKRLTSPFGLLPYPMSVVCHLPLFSHRLDLKLFPPLVRFSLAFAPLSMEYKCAEIHFTVSLILSQAPYCPFPYERAEIELVNLCDEYYSQCYLNIKLTRLVLV